MQKKIIENCQKQENDLWVNGYFMIVTMVTIQYMIDFFYLVLFDTEIEYHDFFEIAIWPVVQQLKKIYM